MCLLFGHSFPLSRLIFFSLDAFGRSFADFMRNNDAYSQLDFTSLFHAFLSDLLIFHRCCSKISDCESGRLGGDYLNTRYS